LKLIKRCPPRKASLNKEDGMKGEKEKKCPPREASLNKEDRMKGKKRKSVLPEKQV
jgi:hypothetical protein